MSHTYCKYCGKQSNLSNWLNTHIEMKHGPEIMILLEIYGIPLELLNDHQIYDTISNSISDLTDNDYLHWVRCKRIAACSMLYAGWICATKFTNNKLRNTRLSILDNKWDVLMKDGIINSKPDIEDIIKSNYFIFPDDMIEDLSKLSPDFKSLSYLRGARDLAIVISMKAHKDLIKTVLRYHRMIYL